MQLVPKCDDFNKAAAGVMKNIQDIKSMCFCAAANLPEPKGALLGSMDKNSEQFKKAAAEAVRTIPGREHGGNCDIKNLTRGCKVSRHGADLLLC